MSQSPTKGAGHYAIDTFAALYALSFPSFGTFRRIIFLWMNFLNRTGPMSRQKKRKRMDENASCSPAKPTAPASPMRRPLSPWNKTASKEGSCEPALKKTKVAELVEEETDNQPTTLPQQWQKQIGELEFDMKRLGDENERLAADLARICEEREILVAKLVRAQEAESLLKEQILRKNSDEKKMMVSFDDEVRACLVSPMQALQLSDRHATDLEAGDTARRDCQKV